MQAQTSVDPWWAALTVWGVVNAVNLLQANALRHPRALPPAFLRRDPADGPADVPLGSAAVARHCGDHGSAAGVDGRCDAEGCRVSH